MEQKIELEHRHRIDIGIRIESRNEYRIECGIEFGIKQTIEFKIKYV